MIYLKKLWPLITIIIFCAESVIAQTTPSLKANLRWTIPTEDVDGNELNQQDIAGYNIYDLCNGRTHRVDNASIESIELDFLLPYTCSYAISTVMKNGIESARSQPAHASTQVPSSPGNLSVTVTVTIQSSGN